MATPTQPPRPPAALQPPRSRSNFLWISLLLLALIGVVAGLGILMGVRLLSNAVHINVNHTDSGRKDVSIKTPFGGLEVHQGMNEAGLGVPIYPGAVSLKEDDSATVDLNIADKDKLRVLAGKFEAADCPDKVIAFYHDRLGNDVTKVKNENGRTVFELKRGEDTKVVAIRAEGAKTIIEIAHISQGVTEAN
jgi:hypothetical protein